MKIRKQNRHAPCFRSKTLVAGLSNFGYCKLTRLQYGHSHEKLLTYFAVSNFGCLCQWRRLCFRIVSNYVLLGAHLYLKCARFSQLWITFCKLRHSKNTFSTDSIWVIFVQLFTTQTFFLTVRLVYLKKFDNMLFSLGGFLLVLLVNALSTIACPKFTLWTPYSRWRRRR